MHIVYITKPPKTGIDVYLFDEADSTNNVIKNGDYKAFDVVLANVQTNGRGRNGKPFISNQGGLYFSMLIPADGSSADEYITPLAGVAAVKALKAFGISAKIKWVNDIFVKSRKICGILAERFTKNGADYIALGIGINVNNEDFGEYKNIATSMSLEKYVFFKTSDVAAALMDNLIALIKENDKKSVMELYKKYSMVIGKNIVLAETDEKVFVKDIDENGALVVADASGSERIVNSGSIFFGGY
ncbi:MAG: biotin--[acetyl-CoA-carboxylase] ligase [Clostridiales bacterium]|jgi:BirA family biotin operon repressor/biotin-[acetyl-CoA-carboxylase] ligase|nr:biotin--[acetyl-CoA-carboxylase] ligase [Clostridiales bacterium]